MQAACLTPNLSPQQRAFLLELVERSQAKTAHSNQHWEAKASLRPDQLPPPGDWSVWLILAGRGWGKTQAGAIWTIQKAMDHSGGNGAIIGQTVDDVRKVMVRGVSGILGVAPDWFRPVYNPSNRELVFPNGCRCSTYSGDVVEQFRGPGFHFAWADEPAKWKYASEAWNQLEFTMRRGPLPQTAATTTPRPIPLLKKLLVDEGCVVTRGETDANKANLSAVALARLKDKYAGTRLGRQELEGVMLDDAPGALWKREWLDEGRVIKAPQLKHVVVGVDPQVGEGENAAETGIVVAGVGQDGHGYILADATVQGSPGEWASAAVVAYHMHKADRLVAEENQGGKMVAHTIRMTDPKVAYMGVHASRGKIARAEPVAALYEQGKIHHIGSFPLLEDQLCLAADSQITTSQGLRSICAVKPGDMVLTRKGYRKVIRAWETHPSARVMRIYTSDGRSLTGTAEHPVFVKHVGWVQMGSLTGGDELEAIEWKGGADGDGVRQEPMVRPGEWVNTGRRSNGMADCGGLIERVTTDTPKVNSSTTPSGNWLMGLFQRAWMCITRTRTSRILPLRICNFLLEPIICFNMSPEALGHGHSSSIANTPSECGVIANRISLSASIAELLARPLACDVSYFAPQAADPITITTSERLIERIPVWCLKVEGEPEYYANGILVHNCEYEASTGQPSPDRYDACVWAITELMLEGKDKRGWAF